MVPIVTSIIIPVLNNWKLTKNCLVSLARYTLRKDFEVIVVDNGSTDETKTLAKAFGKNLFADRFKYVPLPENINFAPACNLGAKLARGKFLFFLNNDTLVTSNWLSPLLEVIEKDNTLGGVGPLLLYPDDTVQHLGVVFNLQKRVYHLYEHFPVSHRVVKKERYFQVITAAALLVKKDVFWSVQGFFSKFRNGFEDVDFCLRLKNKGKKFLVCPKSIVYHLCSKTPNRFKYEEYNSKLVSKRCAQWVVEDSYLYLLEDGYFFELTKYLRLLPKISKEKEKYYLSKPFDPFLLANDFLVEEPFWLDGYKKLMDFFLLKKDLNNFLAVCKRSLEVLPFEVIFPLLTYAYKQTQSGQLKTVIEKTKKTIIEQEYKFNTGIYKKIAKNLLGKNEYLDKALNKWFTSYYS